MTNFGVWNVVLFSNICKLIIVNMFEILETKKNHFSETNFAYWRKNMQIRNLFPLDAVSFLSIILYNIWCNITYFLKWVMLGPRPLNEVPSVFTDLIAIKPFLLHGHKKQISWHFYI